jgi:cell wall-associated NlpC family hydrolase
MSRWFFILLLACASAQAAPDAAPAAGPDNAQHQQRLLSQFGEIRHNVSMQAHEVVDRTSDLVITAMGFLGVPYRRGGTSADTGFDCSGFVRAMYEKTAGLLLPRRADQQAAFAEKIDKKDLQPGDLVFFNTMRRAFSHVGIYVGDGKFIHSPRSGSEVRVEDMHQSYWTRRFDGARRVSTPVAAVPATAPSTQQ